MCGGQDGWPDPAFSALGAHSRLTTFPLDFVRVVVVVRGAIRVLGRTGERALFLSTAPLFCEPVRPTYALSRGAEVIIVSLPRAGLSEAAHRNLRVVTAMSAWATSSARPGST